MARARAPHRQHTVGSVLAHASKNHTGRIAGCRSRDRMEQHVHGRAVSGHSFAAITNLVGAGSTKLETPCSGCQIGMSGKDAGAVSGLGHANGAQPVKSIGQARGEIFRQVLGDEDGGALRRHPLPDPGDRLDPPVDAPMATIFSVGE
jgi:hypothetical protein